MFSSATKTSASVTEDLAQRDMDNKKDSMKNEALQKVERTVDDISDYANKAGTYVRDFVDNAACRIDETNKMVTDEVRTSPVKSVMIATGIGFLLGMLFRSKA